MGALSQSSALVRRLYTGEGVQQARRAVEQIPAGGAPIPVPASPAQVYLEARFLLGLLESEERATEILFNLLPAQFPGAELHGVPGLRITHRSPTAVELRVLGQPTRLCLTGLPSRVWRSAERNTLTKWIDPDGMLLCWSSSPWAWTPPERGHHAMWHDEGDPVVQVQHGGAWLASGLLRRAALLHTVSNTFLVDGYRSLSSDLLRLVVRSSQVRDGDAGGP